MIVGLGVDLARASRFSKLLAQEKRGVIKRLFTPGELAYALAMKNPAPHLAARFAAKEAFVKALGLGLRSGMRWQEIEVERNELGAPSLRLLGQAAARAAERQVTAIHLSYSHEGDYATATVILESR
jgi:holo-[acyl-carrier protein] synthase